MDKSNIRGYWDAVLKNKQLLAILLVALVLRVIFIDVRRPGFDEPWTLNAISKPYAEMMDIVIKEGKTPPLFYLIISGMHNIISNTLFLYSVPILAGIAAVYLVYILSRDLFGKKKGLVAALLMSVLSFSVYYSQTLRTYSLTAMLFVLLLIAINRYNINSGKRYLAHIFILNVLLLYNHYQGLAIVGTEFLYFIYRKFKLQKGLMWPISVVIASGIAYIPWMLSVTSEISNTIGSSWVKIGFTETAYMFYKFFVGVNVSTAAAYFYLPVIFSVFFGVLFIFSFYKTRKTITKKHDILPFFFFGPILISLLITPIFAFMHYRFLSYLVTILAILLAGSIETDSRKGKILLAAIVIFWVISDAIYFSLVQNPVLCADLVDADDWDLICRLHKT